MSKDEYIDWAVNVANWRNSKRYRWGIADIAKYDARAAELYYEMTVALEKLEEHLRERLKG